MMETAEKITLNRVMGIRIFISLRYHLWKKYLCAYMSVLKWFKITVDVKIAARKGHALLSLPRRSGEQSLAFEFGGHFNCDGLFGRPMSH